MSKIKSTSYISWKSWDLESFGKISPGISFSLEQQFRWLRRNNCTVLEIGFGSGELLTYLKGKGHTVCGVEINPELVDWARAAGFEAYHGNVWEISDLKAEKYDLIAGLSVAEHMDENELELLFEWCQDHLNPAGTLFLKFPEAGSPLALGYQHGDFTHRTTLTRAKLDYLCKRFNLRLHNYSDEKLVSNKLCSLGAPGRFILIALQLYAMVLKFILMIILFPLCPSLKFSTNSIAMIGLSKEKHSDSICR